MRLLPRHSLLCLLALALAPLLLFGPCVVGARSYVPFDLAQWPPIATQLQPEQLAAITAGQNSDVSEVPFTFLPELVFANQQLQQGRLPEWNPYARAGAPLLATSVVGLLYPPNWLFLLTGNPLRGLAFGAWFALAAAGLLTFGLLRRLGHVPAVALFGGLAFQLSATLSANAHFYQRLNALVWLPGMLWAIAAIARGNHRGSIGLALTTGLTWTAGFAPYAAPATGVAGLFALQQMLQAARWDGLAGAARTARACALGFVLGFGLAAVQLLPMFAFFPESNRDPHPSLDAIANQAFDPLGVLGYLLPDVFGHSTATQSLPYEKSPLVWWLFSRASWVDGKPFPPNYNLIEYAVFPGTLVLVLAWLGCCVRGARDRFFAAGTWLLLLVLASGSALVAPLFSLPGFASLSPMRCVGPAAMLVVLLAARGLAAGPRQLAPQLVRGTGMFALGLGALCLAGAWWLTREPPQELLARIAPAIAAHYQPRLPSASPAEVMRLLEPFAAAGHERLIGGLIRGAIGLWLAAVWLLLAARAAGVPLRHKLLLAYATCATVAELVAYGAPLNHGRVLHEPRDTPVHAFLRAERDASRERGGVTVARAGQTLADGVPRAVLPLQLPPCTLVPEGIRDLNIYTFVDGKSHRLFERLYDAAHMVRTYWPLALFDDERLALPLFDLFGLRFLLATQPLLHAGRKVGPTWKGPGGEFFVYERPRALPRAFVVGDFKVLPDETAVVEAMVRRDFAPDRVALLLPADHRRLADHAVWPDAGRRNVRFTLDRNNHIHLQVDAGPPGLLVLADAYFSGWNATVNDVQAPVVRGNLFCRLVPIPEDECRVHLRYATPWLGPGLGISVLALLALLLLGRRRS